MDPAEAEVFLDAIAPIQLVHSDIPGAAVSVPKWFGGVVSSLYLLSFAVEFAWITGLSLKMLRFDSLAWAFLIVADVHSRLPLGSQREPLISWASHGRAHYILVALTAVIFALWLDYWNLLDGYL